MRHPPRYAARVLVISPMSELIKSWLETKVVTAFNISVITANSGLEGIKQAEKEHPTMIIIDDKLPDASGMSMSGMSVSSIIKGSPLLSSSIVYLFNVSNLVSKTKCDFFLPEI